MSTRATIRRFGTGTRVYDFPPTIMRWSDNFANLVTQSDRLPGLDGGFDVYGSSPAPSEIGTVDVSFWIVPLNEQQITDLKDQMRAIAGWGKLPLFLQPYDLTKAERYCNARVKSINMPEDAELCTNKQQEIRITFEVPEARWFAFPTGTNQSYWDGVSSIWGSPACIWGGSAGIAYTGPGPQTVNVTTVGNAVTLPLIKLTCSAVQTITNPLIERVVNGLVIDSIQFTGSIPAGEVLIIDTQRLQAKLNATDVYDNLTILRSNWLSLPPGLSQLRFSSGNALDAGTIKIQYVEAYY